MKMQTALARCASRGAWCSLALLFLIPADMIRAEETSTADRTPNINVVFLDDGTLGLPETQDIRYNQWEEWERRLPTFLSLVSLVADFQRASGEKPSDKYSLYTLEINAKLTNEKKDACITAALESIFNATNRPSVILARSTAGEDHLRIVVQDRTDYTPEYAAAFLRELAAISPYIADRRVAANFGPFQPPPTVVVDPRLVSKSSQPAGYRWHLLEGTYLLPHYVLHHIAVLNSEVIAELGTFYADTTPEPGTVTVAIADRVQGKRIAAHESALNRRHSFHAHVSKTDGEIVVQEGGFWGSTKRFTSEVDAANYLGERYKRAGELGKNIVWTSPDQSLKQLAPGSGTTQESTYKKKLTLVPGGSQNQQQQVQLGKELGCSELQIMSPNDAQSANQLDVQGYNKVAIYTDQGNVEALKSEVGEASVSPYPVGQWKIAPKIAPKVSVGKASVGFDGIEWDKSSVNDNFYGPGGILFSADNVYVLDPTGSLFVEGKQAIEAIESGSNVFRAGHQARNASRLPLGPANGRGHLAKPEVLAVLNVAQPFGDLGSLPFAVPNIFTPAPDSEPVGDWTVSVEPVSCTSPKELSDSRFPFAKWELAVVPGETQGALRYAGGYETADASDTEDTGALVFGRFDSEFQPRLLPAPNGGLWWILQHGLIVEFATDRVVQAIVGPGGERIEYVREDGKLKQQKASDGRELMVDNGSSLSRKLRNQEGVDVTLDKTRNAIVVSRDGRVAEWRFQPDRSRLTGVITKDASCKRATLWTRSGEGRIIQMAIGRIESRGKNERFVPELTVGHQKL